MKSVSVLALCLLAGIASGQYLEKTVTLPDTLGPLSGPYHMAWDENPDHPRLYVGGEADSGGVIVANAMTCKRLARIPSGPVKSLCFVPLHRKLYVANLGSSTIKVVDGATNQVVSTISVAGVVPVMQYNSVSDRLYCGGNSMSVIDCASDTIVHTIPVAAAVFAFDSSRNKLYAGGSGPLSVIDCERDSVVATISRVDSAGALCFNPTAAKVYTTSGDTLFAVHANADTIVARLGFTGLAPTLACDPQRDRVYCSHSGHWSSIDCATDSVLLTADGGSTTFLACNVAQDRLYLGSDYWGVYVSDATTGQFLTNIITDGTEVAAWSAGLDRLFTMPESWGRLLTAIDGRLDSIVGAVPLRASAASICLDTVGNRLYFMSANATIGCIGVVDCSQNVVSSYIYAGENPGSMCFNPNNSRLYWGTRVGYSDGGTIEVYDCAAGKIVKRVPVASGVRVVQLHTGLNKLYAEVYDDSSSEEVILVIDCNGDSVAKRVTLDDDMLMKLFLVPEDNRLWYLGVTHVTVIDCAVDSIVADTAAHLGSIDDAVVCQFDRRIYTSNGDALDMDNPARMWMVPGWGGNRFCYVPNRHKLYSCINGGGPRDGRSSFKALDCRNDSITAAFAAPTMVSGMLLDHTGNYIYCAGYEDSLVLVVGISVDTVVTTVRTSACAAARDPLAANRRTGRIYEAGYGVTNARGIPVIRDSMIIGLEELGSTPTMLRVEATMLSRGVPFRATEASVLLDICGRKVVALHPGANDVRHLSPGVYFVRQPSAVSRQPFQCARS